MKIIAARPPNFAKIVAVFPLAARPTTVFCYGKVIYYPAGKPLEPSLLAHEGIHSRRQLDMGVDNWWDRYLADPQFRLEEEIPAHRAEFERSMEGANRGQRRAALRHIAHRLAGPLYGKMLTVHEAKRLITGSYS